MEKVYDHLCAAAHQRFGTQCSVLVIGRFCTLRVWLRDHEFYASHLCEGHTPERVADALVRKIELAAGVLRMPALEAT